MLAPSTRIESCQGANVPVRTDRHGNDVVSLWSRRSTKEIMFSEMHASATALPRKGDGWVPCTTTLPMQVVERPGLEDGVIVTLNQMLDVLHPGYRVLC
jgi:hypothetical protein